MSVRDVLILFFCVNYTKTLIIVAELSVKCYN